MQDLNISIKQEFKASDFTDDMKGKLFWIVNKERFGFGECCFLEMRKEEGSEYILYYDYYSKFIDAVYFHKKISKIKLPADYLIFFFDEIEAKSYYYDFAIKNNKITNTSSFNNETNLELKNKYIQILNKTLLENEINKLISEIEDYEIKIKDHQIKIKEKTDKLKSLL